MGEKVVGLRGEAITAIGAPSEETVECLERLLAEAKRGEIIGIAYTLVKNDAGRFATGWIGSDHRNTLLSGAACLVHRMAAATMPEE